MIDVGKIKDAAEVIRGMVLKTPLIHSEILSRMLECEVYLKLENQQKTGSFKIRGAAYKIMKRLEAIGPLGVVTGTS
jgi:threonine dehydratase